MSNHSVVAGKSASTMFSATTRDVELAQRRLALTVAAHPDLSRIGERFIFDEAATSGSIHLSREEPRFTRLGAGRRQQPLDDLHLSRTPIVLRLEEVGGFSVEVTEKHRSVYLEGVKLGAGRHRLSAARLSRGAVLFLSRRIVLFLHFVGLRQSQTEDFGIVGESDAIVEVRNQLPTLARLRYPLLIRGETGTGKELVAQALRKLQGPSRRFVSLNLAETPPALAAARLFGSEKGAFTGAKKLTGAFSEADGGILFLDEIGDLAPEVQPMLLRVLETGEVRPLGSEASFEVKVWLTAATDMPLEDGAGEKRFRAQLFYRLFQREILLPPLRERREDLGRLMVHLLRRELADLTSAPPVDDVSRDWLPARLIARLMLYSWPGNVRELRNVVRTLIATAAADRWRVDPARLQTAVEPMLKGPDLEDASGAPAPSGPKSPAVQSTKRRPAQLTREDLVAALDANHWNVKRTADHLGIPRNTFYNKMKRCGLRTTESLSRDEITAALGEHENRLEDVAQALQVSLQGLMARMTRLGLDENGGDDG